MPASDPRRVLLLVPGEASVRLAETLGGRRIAAVAAADLGEAFGAIAARRFDVAIVGARPDGSENDLCRALRAIGVTVVLLSSVAGLVEVNARRKASGANLALASTWKIEDLLAAIETLSSAAPGAPFAGAELVPIAPPEIASKDPAWVLGSTCAMRKTGSVTIRTAELERNVFMAKGVPVYAKSNAPGERFGALLVRKGKVTSAKIDAAVALAKKRMIKLGEALVEMGFLKAEELVPLVRAQFVERTLGAFALPCTATKWEEHPVLARPDQMGVPPEHLLVDGLRRSYDPRRLKPLLPDATVLKLAPSAPALDAFGFTPLEAAPLALVDGEKKVSMLVVSSKSPADAMRGLYAAVCAGLLRP